MRVIAKAALRVAAALLALGVVLPSLAEAVEPAGTVTISGKTFRFGKRYPVLVNALVRVREYPGIWALSDEKGDYELTVPDDANVTPYIVSGWNGAYTDPRTEPLDPMVQHYNSIDLQTFHTRGENIVNANFQTPTDLEYNVLRELVEVPSDADGRPQQCVIVTTSSARNVRGVDYDTYWDRTPHGVAGATAYTLPDRLLPLYFNDSVLPDPDQPSSSGDGGIIWRVVPTGTYRVVTEHPTARFASFLATCAPGRVVNANPPWGAYELAAGEQPLAASDVAASLRSATAVRKGKKRLVTVRFEVGETVRASIGIAGKGGRPAARSRAVTLKPAVPDAAGATGDRVVKMPLKASSKPGKGRVTAVLTDAAGVSFTYSAGIRIPKKARKARKAKKKARVVKKGKKGR